MKGFVFFTSLFLSPFLVIANMAVLLKYGAAYGFAFLFSLIVYYYWLFKDKSKNTEVTNNKNTPSKKPSYFKYIFKLGFKGMKKHVNEYATSQSSSVRLIVSALMIAVCFLAIIGGFSNYLVANHAYINLFWVALIISLVIYMLVLYLYINRNSYYRKTIDKLEVKYRHVKLTLVLPLIFFVPGFIIPAVTKGLPLIPHYFVGQYSEYTVTVADKPNSYPRKGCAGRIRLVEYSYKFNDSLCGLNKPDWELLNVGDHITMIGKSSNYGFSVTGYKLK